MGILGQHISKELCDALGLPLNTISMTLRARVGEFVTVECEYIPENGDCVAALAQYRLIPATTKAREARHPAEVMGYDAWRRDQLDAEHRKYMSRTSKPLRCDWSAEGIARYMGAPV